MTYVEPANDARNAPHDAIVQRPTGLRGFNRYWTARAVRLLRRLQTNPFVTQKRNSGGYVDENGNGAVCANQALIEFLDGLRHAPNASSFAPIDRILPVSSAEIINWNDSQYLSFAAIADKIEEAAGGPEVLAEA